MTRERPILFSGPMVRAILSGAKTQTRRVVSRGNTVVADGETRGRRLTPSEWSVIDFGDARWGRYGFAALGAGGWNLDPEYIDGDRLWVRETFARVWAHADGPSDDDVIEYRADTNARRPGGWSDEKDAPNGARWKPSIFMPRAASRLTLEIAWVRVERVQDIREEDAKAEGVGYAACPCDACESYRHREAFSRLWDQINGKRPGCSWEANPWVWAISFRRVEASA